MTNTFEGEDYLLRWPLDLFRRRLANLINSHRGGSNGQRWIDEVELFLFDAFQGERAFDDFKDAEARNGSPSAVWSPNPASNGAQRSGEAGRAFLIRLLRAADSLPQEIQRRPYRSQRRSGDHSQVLISTAAASAQFVTLVSDLQDRGYFERFFEKDCVDDPATVDPAALIEGEIGVADLWPLSSQQLAADEDVFLDVIEVVGEFVAAPHARTFHSYGQCGWHHEAFHISEGRDLYYWLANRLLGKTALSVRLATSGADRGRLIEVSGDARNDLVAQTVDGASEESKDPIEHAVALFRRRGASTEEKRSACVALAGVLESRRQLLRDELFRRDEGALFRIANEFDLRQDGESAR